MNQPYRLLSIYQALIGGKTVNKVDLANKWEVSTRTIQRDIAHIRNFMYESCDWFMEDDPIVYDHENDSYFLNRNIQQFKHQHAFLQLKKIERQKIFVKFEVDMTIWCYVKRKYPLKKYSSNHEFVIAGLYTTPEEALKLCFEYRGVMRLLEPEPVKEKLIHAITYLHDIYQKERTE
ncbi:HTH domain-containing protein [Staphylococcus delphini]|uniref:HTH domain-containing protein n=1 Tax=Staphylococcus delphini TaxID=53344 RepID=A0AAP8DS13_9STAP|nr:HTH domain-containing protein [Staphylococcus delphini]MDE9752029.1 HTH domain-containing protein [Staphylococcus delphini]MDE9790659.1 HTH domain-containing protein [Staphylococcus delphini]MDE9793028.1 HTH domain-containing protein [Staphylococcus delphini]MDE9793986.1 HTH domain-containing protein [Staphylococcus delphini]MDE9797509.1 HTH domain-containing protein [Staphylococcus delphini]